MKRDMPPPPVPPFSPFDEFGLPNFSWIEELGHPDKKERRLIAVRRFAFRAFQAVARHLGKEKADELFASFAQERPVRRGHKTGSTNPERDEALLSAYDSAQTQETVPLSHLAGSLYDQQQRKQRSGYFGSSPGAIEKHLRRLLRARSRRRILEEARYRRMESWAKKTLLEQIPPTDPGTTNRSK